MLRCHEKFKTPWSLINHLLLCLETSKGDVSCQECQPSHQLTRLMSPVHLWRRLSGGKKRANGASLDWPLAKRGRVDELEIGGDESLPRYEDMSKYEEHGQGRDFLQYPYELVASEDLKCPADFEQLEALVPSSEGLFSNTPNFSMPRYPLQQSWCEQPRELAAGPVSTPTRHVAVEPNTSRSRFSGASASQMAVRQAPEHPWSTRPYDSTVCGTSPGEMRSQKQTYAGLVSPRSSFHCQQDDPTYDPRQGLRIPDPMLRGVSGYNLASLLEESDPLEMEDGGDAQWYDGPDYGQAAIAERAYETDRTSTMAQSAAHMSTPGVKSLRVVTQPMPMHTYGQGHDFWLLANYQPPTPVSMNSGASAASQNSVRWPFTGSSSSFPESYKAESTTKVPTSGVEAAALGKRRASGAERSEQSLLVSPLSQGTVQSEDNISPSTDSNQDDACPYCDHQPKGSKNYRTHLKRHIKTHEPGHELRCQVHGCGSTFAAGRKDNLRSHMNKVHSIPDPAAEGSRQLNVPSMTPTATSPSTSLGKGERPREISVVQSGAGHFEDHGIRRYSNVNVLTGISSDRGIELDSLQTPGGLSPVEEGKDNASQDGERPLDLGPTAWNTPGWI